jgi:hypothetical protein
LYAILARTDDSYTLTLARVPDPSVTPRSYLEHVLKRLEEADEFELRDPAFFDDEGPLLLRYRARLSEQMDEWQWNYWGVALAAETGISLHISVNPGAVDIDHHERRILLFAAKSLRADFGIEP